MLILNDFKICVDAFSCEEIMLLRVLGCTPRDKVVELGKEIVNIREERADGGIIASLPVVECHLFEKFVVDDYATQS